MAIQSLKLGIKEHIIPGVRLIICFGFLPLVLAGCFSFGRPKTESVKVIMQPELPAYSGPRATLTMADFDVKAAKATSEIGAQLRRMVAQSLTASNRFVMVERGENERGTPPGQANEPVQSSELIITAAVTEFEPQVSGGSGGIGGGGGEARGALGGLLGSNLNKAHMALEIRIADAATSKVLATSIVQGQATDVSGIFPGEAPLGDGLSAYAKTPMEKAIRICVIEAVRRISESIPVDYYKYNINTEETHGKTQA